MEPPKYKKMPDFATTDGQELEWTLSALLFLRGLNSGHDFEIASNVAGAGVFDDIVFRFKPSEGGDTWITSYVQLKFRASKPISKKLLKNKNEKFYVPHYFKSYREIKQAMSNPEKGTLFDGSFENSEFMIYTNAKASEGLGMECSRPMSKSEELICGNLGKFFSFEEDEDILNSLDDCGDEGKEFLGRFRVFCSQPTPTELEKAIEIELSKVNAELICGVDVDRLSKIFLEITKVWWKSSNDVLCKCHDLLLRAVEICRLEIASQQTKIEHSVALDFGEVCLTKLRDSVVGDSKVVIVQSSERSCRLSFTKLYQALGRQALALDCGGLLANKVSLLAQWQKINDKILIICTNDWNEERQVNYISVVNELLAIQDGCPIVFLSHDKSYAVTALAGKFPGVKRCEDDFLFSQLTDKSRDSVLAKKVSLQGQLTSLFELLNGHRKEVDLVLDAGSVMEVLGCVDIVTLGSAFDKGIDYYVDRNLEQATVVKASVFQDGTLQGNVTVRVMQCEAKENLSVERDIIAIPRISDANNRGGLFKKAVSFLFSQNDATSLHSVSLGKIVSNLSQSVLASDKDNCEVFIGPKFSFGLFECNSVGLRFGQQDAVFALRVHTKKHPLQAGFLFVSDKTSENDIKKLSDFHHSKHLLLLENGLLRWIQSHGDIESIRPHIDEDQITKFTPKNAMDVEDRLVLVCAEPGMGKSTLMARLAKNTKEAHPHHFVFLIALNDHSQLFARDTHKDVLKFLCSANKIDSHLHRSLLKFALEVSGNVVLLFDGFDEIAPKYVKQSCTLLTSLIEKSKASKIWMTSRNSIKSTLEASIVKLSMRLQKFIEEDQISFLKEFWKSKTELSEIELDNFSKKLITKTSQAVRDKEKDFIGIPLQTQMLAEVYEDHVTGSTDETNLPDNLDLLVLLEQFVDKKCDIYVQDKVKISPVNPLYEEMLENVRRNFIEDHRKAALILILDDDEVQILHMKSIVKDSSEFFKKIESGTYKTGFIDSIVNGKPRFLHRVFAEYFVAKWISENFAENREFIESKMFTADFAVVRNIFDRILGKDCFLHTAVLNEDLMRVRTLLQHADVDAKDGGGRTALHLAASRGTSEDREENKRRGEIMDLLIANSSNFDQVDDVFGGTPLKYADITRSWIAVDRLKPCQDNKAQLTLILEDFTNHRMLDTVYNFDLHHLLNFCLDNGLQVEHCFIGNNRLLSRACEIGSFKMASLLITRNADIQAIDYMSRTPLHKASEKGHTEIVRLLLKLKMKLLNFPTPSQQYLPGTYINMGDTKGQTAIYSASQNGHSEVISILIDQGGDPKCRGKHNSTPLHIAARLRYPKAVSVLLEALDEDDQAAAVNSKDNKGHSVLMRGASGGCVKCVGLIVKAGGKMTLRNDTGRTPLMEAASEGHQEVVSYLLNNFNAESEGMNRHDYINMEDTDGPTAIFYAAKNDHSEVVSFLIGNGGNSQIRDKNNSTPLHNAAEFKHPNTVSVLLEALDEADRAAAVNSNYKKGYSVLMYGALGGCVECVGLIVKAGGKMTLWNDDGQTPLMLAAQEGHQEVVRYLLNNFNAESEGMNLHDYINKGDNDGCTAIYYAASNGHSEVLSFLIGQGGDSQCYNNDNSTPLQIAAEFNHHNVLSVLLEALDEADRAAAVNSKDNTGESMLIRGALSGCVECVGLIVKAGGKITLRNDNGLTPLMLAAQEGHQEVVSYLLNNLNAESEGINLHDYINMKKNNGWTGIRSAAENDHSEVYIAVYDFLISQGGDSQSRYEDNSTALHIAAENKHPHVVSVLLEAMDEADQAAAVNSKDKSGESVLMSGAFGGCVECVELIVKAGGKMTLWNDDGQTPLMLAAQEGHQDVVSYLLNNFNAESEGMNLHDYINMGDNDGWTAIYYAASKNHSEVISFLIGQGGDSQCHNNDNSTPLHWAAEFKHPNVVNFLLEALDEADRAAAVNSKDNDGDSVLIRGAFGGCVECVELIVKAGGKMTLRNDNGQTPLMLAAKEGHLEVVSYLLSNLNAESEGMNLQDYINMGDTKGRTAIHKSAKNGHSEVISFLIGQGADPQCCDRYNSTPLHFAAEFKHPNTVSVLLEAMDEADRAAAVNSKDKNGDSVLMRGAFGGCVECVELIVKAGGKMTLRNDSGQTPLMAAALEDHVDIVRFLLKNFNPESEEMNLPEYINMEDIEELNVSRYVARNGHSDDASLWQIADVLKNDELVGNLLKILDESDKDANKRGILRDNELICENLGGCMECIVLLVRAGEEITLRNDNGLTPLMAAALKSHQEVVSYLLNNFNAEREGINLHDYIKILADHSGDPQLSDYDNSTPLHIAAKLKHPIAVSVLLEALDEADRAAAVNSKDKNGDSVLMRGALSGCVECVGLIVKAGGKMTLRKDNGQTPLMLAAQEGHHEVVSYLLDNFNEESEGMNLHDYINMGDTNKQTAVYYAAFNGHSEVIRFFTSHGGNPQFRDDNNSTPLHIAAEFKHPNTVRVLLEAMDEAERAPAVNSKDKNGDSVLMRGTFGGCVECVELIVMAGGKITLRNDNGQTPLMSAALNGHHEVASYLLDNFNEESEGMNLHDYINMGDTNGLTAIHDAAWNGQSEVISFLSEHGGDPQCRDKNNGTPLHFAAEFKQPNAVSVLLEALDEADRAAAVNSKDKNGDSVLMRGALSGCVECVELIVNAGGKMTLRNDNGQTPLMLVAFKGHREVFSYLLDNFNTESEGMNLHDYIKMVDTNGRTAIHNAAWNGQSEIISILIDHGGDAQCRDRHNCTPLHIAAQLKHPYVISVLLEALDEADRAAAVNSKDNDGDSVLMCAALGGCVECVGLIVMAGGKMTLRNDYGQTPLMLAALQCHQDVVSYLLDNFNEESEGMNLHAYINMGDTNGLTAIHDAAWNGQSEIISILIDHGGDAQCRNKHNCTPLHNAAENKQFNAVSVLLEALDEADRAAAVNSKYNDGDSVLMCAALGGCVECVELIVNAGGKMTQVSNDGGTPLMAAAIKGFSPVVAHLLSVFEPERECCTKLAYVNMVDKCGNTALDLACLECYEILQGFLIDLLVD